MTRAARSPRRSLACRFRLDLRVHVPLVGLLAVLAAAAPAHIAAQDFGEAPPDSVRPPGVFVTGALGTGAEVLSGLASVQIPAGGGAVVIRAAGVSDFEIFKDPSNSVSDVAVLYGFSTVGSRGWGRASIGLGLATEVERGEKISGPEFLFGASKYQRLEDRSPGVAIQLDGVWAFSDFLGLGGSVFGNLSGVRPLAGLTFGVVMGDLR